MFCGNCGAALGGAPAATAVSAGISPHYLKLKRFIGISFLASSAMAMMMTLLQLSQGDLYFGGMFYFMNLMVYPALGVLFLVLKGKILPPLMGIVVLFSMFTALPDLVEYLGYLDYVGSRIYFVSCVHELIFLPMMLVLALCSTYIPSDGFRRIAGKMWFIAPLMMCFRLVTICDTVSTELFSYGALDAIYFLFSLASQAALLLAYFLYSLLYIKYHGDMQMEDPDTVPSVYNLADTYTVNFRFRGRILIVIAVILVTICVVPTVFYGSSDLQLLETVTDSLEDWELLDDSVAEQLQYAYGEVVDGCMEIFMEPESYGWYSSSFSYEQYAGFSVVLSLPKLLLVAGLWLGLYTIVTGRKPRFFLVSGLKLIRIAQIILTILNCGLFTCMFFVLLGHDYTTGFAVFVMLCICVFGTAYYVCSLTAISDLLHAADGAYLYYEKVPTFLIVSLLTFGTGQLFAAGWHPTFLLDAFAMILLGIGLAASRQD